MCVCVKITMCASNKSWLLTNRSNNRAYCSHIIFLKSGEFDIFDLYSNNSKNKLFLSELECQQPTCSCLRVC
jgi:hypothetical protein